MTLNIYVSEKRPYGAPLVYVRGGGTKHEVTRAWFKENGFRWDDTEHAWWNVGDGEEVFDKFKEAGFNVEWRTQYTYSESKSLRCKEIPMFTVLKHL